MRRSNSQAVLARLRCVGTEGGLERLDVRCLVRADLHEAAANPVGKARVEERLRIVLRERVHVERTLEVLERQSELQDVRLCAWISGRSVLLLLVCSRLGAGGAGAQRTSMAAPMRAVKILVNMVVKECGGGRGKCVRSGGVVNVG